jgi:hypothetical protein
MADDQKISPTAMRYRVNNALLCHAEPYAGLDPVLFQHPSHPKHPSKRSNRP